MYLRLFSLKIYLKGTSLGETCKCYKHLRQYIVWVCCSPYCHNTSFYQRKTPSRDFSLKFWFLPAVFILFFHSFIVVDVQLFPSLPYYSPHPSHPHFPPLTLPLFGFAHVSFIHVPGNPSPFSPHYPFPPLSVFKNSHLKHLFFFKQKSWGNL